MENKSDLPGVRRIMYRTRVMQTAFDTAEKYGIDVELIPPLLRDVAQNIENEIGRQTEEDASDA